MDLELSEPAEMAAFERYWRERQEQTWKATLWPNEQTKPCPKNWGSAFKRDARDAWMARAQLSAGPHTRESTPGDQPGGT